MNIYKRIATSIAAGALLLQSALPAMAATYNLSVTGNGSGSENEVEVEKESEVFVMQSNQTSVHNDVDATAKTGGNSASGNTGGDVSITTGPALSDTEITNELNSNVLEMDLCDCDGDVEIEIADNGSDSDNEAEFETESETTVMQFNSADIDNEVDATAKTGGNEADDNTGGDVDIDTDSATVLVGVTNLANANTAVLGGGEGDGMDIDLLIADNGSDSENEVEVEVEHETMLKQLNQTDIHNDVDGTAKTGGNEADDNTGGDVDIETGPALVDAEIENQAGFNTADLDNCGCELELTATISDNGSDSENEIEAEIELETKLVQENSCGDDGYGWFKLLRRNRRSRDECFDNHVELVAKTGGNEADDNTGEESSSSISTGASSTFTRIRNLGGSNVFGSLFAIAF